MDASASIEIAKHTLVSGGLVLAIGTLTGLLAQKVKIPDVALFLVVGMLIGPAVFGVINIGADSALNQTILLFGASYILFDGGASLRLEILRQVWITIVVIATVGVVITAAITGVAAYFVLGVPLIVALLLGATLSATEPMTCVSAPGVTSRPMTTWPAERSAGARNRPSQPDDPVRSTRMKSKASPGSAHAGRRTWADTAARGRNRSPWRVLNRATPGQRSHRRT